MAAFADRAGEVERVDGAAAELHVVRDDQDAHGLTSPSGARRRRVPP
ncbi:hypothetical protein ACU686_04075 [Yinghuangia aomiensis]